MTMFCRWIVMALGVMLSLSSTGVALAAPVTVDNGITFRTADGHALDAHGGSMIRVGDAYYWFGENRDGANLVSTYRSTDLKTWTLSAHVIRKDMGGELATANIERPKILYNAATATYVLWMHKENGVDYSEARVAVATAPQVDGPYSYLGSFRPLGFDSRDLTVFDDNGTAYLISATRVNADLNIYRLTPDFLSVKSKVATLWPGQYREAPAIFKRGKTYFLVTSGATGWTPNQAKYATAAGVSGPWSALNNLADATTYDTQPAYVLPVHGPARTSYLYLGDRWAGAWKGPVNASNDVWLPLSFPTKELLAMSWSSSLKIDAETGSIKGVPFTIRADVGYEIVNRKSHRLLGVRGHSMSAGADLEQQADSDAAGQRFRLIAAGDGHYQIQNIGSGLLVGVTGGSSANGALIEQWTDGGWTSQHWQLIDAGAGFFKLRNRATAKLLDVSGGSLSEGANVIQWGDNGGQNQHWQFVVAN